MRHTIIIFLSLCFSFTVSAQSDWETEVSEWDDEIIELPLAIKVFQRLNFVAGCNWVSIFIKDGLDVNALSNPNITRIKSEDEECIYVDGKGWVGDLTHLYPGRGYRVFAQSSVEVSLEGNWCGIKRFGVFVHKGWNWIGIPHRTTKDIGNAIESPSAGDEIVYMDLSASYDGKAWVGTLSKLEAGKSYLYKSVNSKTIQFK